MNLKAQYQRFKAWQIKPVSYSKDGLESQHCANCGNDYTGNYCPVCGQPAGGQRLTWQTVHRNVMMMWGMDSRSMPSTIWRLIWSPGHFISNYINGHRQASYPPVKMLFIVALIYTVIRQLIGLDHVQIPLQEGSTYYRIKVAAQWLIDHPSWGMMSLTLIMILPTWVLFRFSPRNNRHTLPESIIIQIFQSTLLFICLAMSDLFIWLTLLIPYYYYISYKQLFGYNGWGTLWRLLVSLVAWVLVLLFILTLSITLSNDNLIRDSSIYITVIVYIATYGSILSLLLFTGYWIGKRGEKHRAKRA